jgi:hypothetical protein
MKRLFTLSVLGLVLVTAPSAFGDIARPKPEPSKSASVPKHLITTQLEIVPDAKTYNGARLQIPESTMKELREALNSGSISQSFSNRVIQSKTNTIVAGLLLFMSISFGGIWLVRSSGSKASRGQKMAAGVLIGVATLGAAAIITRANAGPPPSYFWRSLQKNLSAGKPTQGSLEIEIVADDQPVKLIVPVRNSGNGDD